MFAVVAHFDGQLPVKLRSQEGRLNVDDRLLARPGRVPGDHKDDVIIWRRATILLIYYKNLMH